MADIEGAAEGLFRAFGREAKEDFRPAFKGQQGPRPEGGDRSLGQRAWDLGKDVYDTGTKREKAILGAGVAGAVGLGGYGVSQAGNSPLGTGAAVIGTAVALAARPGDIAATFGEFASKAAARTAKTAIKDGAEKAESIGGTQFAEPASMPSAYDVGSSTRQGSASSVAESVATAPSTAPIGASPAAAYKEPVAPYEPPAMSMPETFSQPNMPEGMGQSAEIPTGSSPSESRYAGTGNRANRTRQRYKGVASDSY